MIDYMLFRVPFAFLDYEKSGALVILENLAMLLFWVFTGAQCSRLLMRPRKMTDDTNGIKC